jgi:hypothetical protein
VYAAPLAAYLAAPDGVLAPCFLDHDQTPCALVPLTCSTTNTPTPSPQLDLALALW